MKGAAVVAALMLMACGGGAVPAVQSSRSSSPTSPIAAAVSPSPIPSTSPLAASCDLPIWLGGHGGFLKYPQGGFTADPASTMLQQPGGQTTQAEPPLHGDGGETYDRPQRRWLPVGANQVSPDGATYAYFDVLPQKPSLTVVDVASGTTRVEFAGDPRFIWSVVAFRSEGIYVSYWNGPGGQDPDAGRLWRVDLSGTLTPMSDLRSVAAWIMAGGYAWDVETDDPSKLNQPGNEERVARLDISSGLATVWFRRTGTLVEPLGVEPNGTALVLVSDPLGLWQVSGPGAERQIASMGAASNTLGDTHGVWLSNSNGIWLATPDAQVLAVAAMAGIPAGDCA